MHIITILEPSCIDDLCLDQRDMCACIRMKCMLKYEKLKKKTKGVSLVSEINYLYFYFFSEYARRL